MTPDDFFTNCSVAAYKLQSQYISGGELGMVGGGENYCDTNVVEQQVCVALMQFWIDQSAWHTYPTVCTGLEPSGQSITKEVQQACTNGTASRYWAVKVTGYSFTMTGGYNSTLVYPADSSGGPAKTKLFACNA